MQKVNVPLNGITHSTSGNVCLDGDMSELTNWRQKDGSLQPTFDTKEIFSMVGKPYKKTFVHQNGNYENWIGATDTGVYWFAKMSGKLLSQRILNTSTLSENLKIATINGFKNIEQLGNIVIVTDTEGIHYLFFKDGGYTYLQTIAIPDIRFTPVPRAVNAEPISPTPTYKFRATPKAGGYPQIAEMDFVTALGADVYAVALGDSGVSPVVSDKTGESLTIPMETSVLAAVNKTQKTVDEYGWLHGVRYLRYAVRLYDGSYVHQSAPQLIIPPKGVNNEEYFTRIKTEQSGYDLIGTPKLFYFLHLYKIHINWDSFSQYEGLSGLIAGVDVFISGPIVRSDYDNKSCFVKDSSDNNAHTIETITTLLPTSDSNFVYDPNSCSKYRFYDREKYNSNIEENSLFYLIKSLTVKELLDFGAAVLDTKKTRDTLVTNEQIPDDSFSHNTLIPESTFMYNGKLHIGSIKTKLFGGYGLTGNGILSKNWLRNYGNIMLFTNTMLNSSGQEVANTSGVNYLVSGMITIPPTASIKLKGYERYFIYTYSQQFVNMSGDLNNNDHETEISAVPYPRLIRLSRSIGSRTSVEYNDGDFCMVDINYWRNDYKLVMTETKVRTSEGVLSTFSKPIGWEYVGSEITPYLCYPDARAESITIWLMDSTLKFVKHRTFILKAHPFLNLSFFINPLFANIVLGDSNFISTDYESDIYGLSEAEVLAISPAYEYTPSKLKVSKVYNPLFFDAVNTYDASGEIVGLASVNESVSEGTAFGTNPLYVFTKRGIQLLEVGTATYYTRMVDGPRDVCVNKDGILPLNSGVVFPTEKGLMVISGTTTRNLSNDLRGVWSDNLVTEPQFQEAVNNAMITTLNDSLTDYSFDEFFESFLEKCTIGYNHHEDEVVLSGYTPTGTRVCFVLNILTGNWHKSTMGIGSFVTSYPKLYRIMESTEYLSIHDMNQNGLPLETLIVTRPIKFGSTAFKKLTKAYFRGEITTGNISNDGTVTVYGYTDLVANNKVFRLMVFGSQDCESWKFIGGVDRMGSRHDIATDLFPVTCKYFRVVFAGKPFYGSRLDGLEFLTEERYGDKPR